MFINKYMTHSVVAVRVHKGNLVLDAAKKNLEYIECFIPAHNTLEWVSNVLKHKWKSYS